MRVSGLLVVLIAFAPAALGQPTTETVREGLLVRLTAPTPLRMNCVLKVWWVRSASPDHFDRANWFEKFAMETGYEVAAVGQDFRITFRELVPQSPPLRFSWAQGECILDWRVRAVPQIDISNNPKRQVYGQPILTCLGLWCFQTPKSLEQLIRSDRFRVTGSDAEGVHFESGFADMTDDQGRFSGVVDPAKGYLPVRLMHEFGNLDADGKYSHRWEMRAFSTTQVGTRWIVDHAGVLSYVGFEGYDSDMIEFTVSDARIDPTLKAEDIAIQFERRGITVFDQIRNETNEYDDQGRLVASADLNDAAALALRRAAADPRFAAETQSRRRSFRVILLASGAVAAACLGAFFIRRGQLARKRDLTES